MSLVCSSLPSNVGGVILLKTHGHPLCINFNCKNQTIIELKHSGCRHKDIKVNLDVCLSVPLSQFIYLLLHFEWIVDIFQDYLT